MKRPEWFAPKEITFFIGHCDGKFLAATRAEPFFCIERETQDEVIQAALAAWGFYLKTAVLCSNRAKAC